MTVSTPDSVTAAAPVKATSGAATLGGITKLFSVSNVPPAKVVTSATLQTVEPVHVPLGNRPPQHTLAGGTVGAGVDDTVVPPPGPLVVGGAAVVITGAPVVVVGTVCVVVDVGVVVGHEFVSRKSIKMQPQLPVLDVPTAVGVAPAAGTMISPIASELNVDRTVNVVAIVAVPEDTQYNTPSSLSQNVVTAFTDMEKGLTVPPVCVPPATRSRKTIPEYSAI